MQSNNSPLFRPPSEPSVRSSAPVAVAVEEPKKLSALPGWVSFWLGITALICFMVPIAAGAIAVFSLVFGIWAISAKRGAGLAVAGFVMSAIALILMALVILALPALQINQRDTQRKNDVALFTTAVNSYQASNKGALPSDEILTDGSFVRNYLKDDYTLWSDPQTDKTYSISTHGTPQAGEVVLDRGVSCDGSKAEINFSVIIGLENGEIYCQ